MTSQNTKLEIERLMSQMSDDQLAGVLEYARLLLAISRIDQEMSDGLSKILIEDDRLLNRLAQ